MDSTEAAEAANEEMLAEAWAFLVECSNKAAVNGLYCDTLVRITHQGGMAIEIEKSNPIRTRLKK